MHKPDVCDPLAEHGAHVLQQRRLVALRTPRVPLPCRDREAFVGRERILGVGRGI